jgi:CBS domain-containing protein
MDLRDLAKLLLEKGITGAPVVDDEGRLAGVISQTDLVYYNLTRGDELVLDSHFYHSARVEGRHVPSGFQFEDYNSGCVADVMTPVVHAVTERTSVESVARMMTRNHIHRVIVRRGQTVAGIISALDVLKASSSRAVGAKKPAGLKRRTKTSSVSKRKAPRKKRVTARRATR